MIVDWISQEEYHSCSINSTVKGEFLHLFKRLDMISMFHISKNCSSLARIFKLNALAPNARVTTVTENPDSLRISDHYVTCARHS